MKTRTQQWMVASQLLLAALALGCSSEDPPEGPRTITDPSGDHYLPHESNAPTSDGAAAFDLVSATVHLDEDGFIRADVELAAPVLMTNDDLASYDMVITGPGGTTANDAFIGGIFDLLWESEGGDFACHLLEFSNGGWALTELPSGATCTVTGSHIAFEFPIAAIRFDPEFLGLSLLTQESRGLDYIVDRIDEPIAPIPGT